MKTPKIITHRGFWTVNDREVFERLKSLGIDYITTDYPKVFEQKLEQSQRCDQA